MSLKNFAEDPRISVMGKAAESGIETDSKIATRFLKALMMGSNRVRYRPVDIEYKKSHSKYPGSSLRVRSVTCLELTIPES